MSSTLKMEQTVSDWLDSLPDHFKCPICMELPKGKVFQCTKGHPLCSECYAKVEKVCPQCRIPFGKVAVRTLILEKMLDEQVSVLGCPFKKFGCGEKMNRKTIQDHVEACTFNAPKFDPSTAVWKSVDLSFKIIDGKESEPIPHQCVIIYSDSYEFTINHFSKLPPNSSRYCIVLDRKQEGYEFAVLITVQDCGVRFVKWRALYKQHLKCCVDSDDLKSWMPYKVECTLKGEEHSMAWNVVPVKIQLSADVDSNSQINFMYMPAYLFVNRFTDSLTISIKLVKQ